MKLDLRPDEDWLHTLQPGEYEAFYFVYTASDGRWFGSVRFLVGAERVLEFVALSIDGEGWGRVSAFPRSELRVEGHSLCGPHLRMTLEVPWQRWAIAFDGPLSRLNGEGERRYTMEALFEAENPAARYLLGSYQQAEQEGWMVGEFHLEAHHVSSRLRAYRDHSWGVRDLGTTPENWKVATAPGHFYLVYIDFARQPVVFGRVEMDDGPHPLRRAEVETIDEQSVRYRFPEYGIEAYSRRVTAPLHAYLGRGGEEALDPRPGFEPSIYDVMGPVLFTFDVEGQEVLGFLEEARKIV